MKKYQTELKLKVVKSFLDGNWGPSCWHGSGQFLREDPHLGESLPPARH